MEEKLSRTAGRLTPSPIQELSQLAQRCGAINLAEGFPDFPAPPQLKQAAVSAINADLNQYRHVQGICDFLAVMMKQNHDLVVDPLTDFAICCGQSEAFAATIFATIDQGDEVVLFDPAYETYESCIYLAGGIPVYVALDPPYWTLDRDKFMKSFTKRTKAVVLNSPHNPTGKVFSKDELETIAEACCNMDCFAITDEVYEYITFDMEKHTSLASLPGMHERTIITSSLSKTFSITGWRIGWACAPANIASAVRNVHIKITDSAPAPFQEAALTALTNPPIYFLSLRTDYEAKRDYIVGVLSGLGFQIRFKPQGSVFVFVELPRNWLLSDVEPSSMCLISTFFNLCWADRYTNLRSMCLFLNCHPYDIANPDVLVDFVRELIKKAGVAAVPGCGFFHADSNGQTYQKRYIRFAFCKSEQTLNAAAQRLQGLVNNQGFLQL